MNEKLQKDDQEDELLLIEFISRKGKIFKNCLATAITRMDESKYFYLQIWKIFAFIFKSVFC